MFIYNSRVIHFQLVILNYFQTYTFSTKLTLGNTEQISKIYKMFTLDYHTLNHFSPNPIIVNTNNNNPIYNHNTRFLFVNFSEISRKINTFRVFFLSHSFGRQYLFTKNQIIIGIKILLLTNAMV